MLPETYLVVGFLIASPVITVLSLLYLREHKLRQNAASKATRAAQEVEQKGAQLLSAAQLAETKILSGSEISTRHLEQQFQTKLDSMLESSKAVVTNSQSNLLSFLSELKTLAEQSQLQSQKNVEVRISDLFEKMESRLSDFLIKTEQNTTSSIELELRSARQLIEGYKQQQIALIDENIVAMMEQTLSIVLAKKLSLKDQLDLIYEALEKAKVEKFLA